VVDLCIGASRRRSHSHAGTGLDSKGTWSGKGKTIVFGNNRYHPGSQTTTSPPRVRDIEATHVVEGQDGRFVWGRSSSSVADTKEPFAWTIASDNKTIAGADMDGSFHITLISPDRMEKCYTQNATRAQANRSSPPAK